MVRTLKKLFHRPMRGEIRMYLYNLMYWQWTGLPQNWSFSKNRKPSLQPISSLHLLEWWCLAHTCHVLCSVILQHHCMSPAHSTQLYHKSLFCGTPQRAPWPTHLLALDIALCLKSPHPTSSGSSHCCLSLTDFPSQRGNFRLHVWWQIWFLCWQIWALAVPQYQSSWEVLRACSMSNNRFKTTQNYGTAGIYCCFWTIVAIEAVIQLLPFHQQAY